MALYGSHVDLLTALTSGPNPNADILPFLLMFAENDTEGFNPYALKPTAATGGGRKVRAQSDPTKRELSMARCSVRKPVRFFSLHVRAKSKCLRFA